MKLTNEQWTDRLNEGPRLIWLGKRCTELLDWSYAPHLSDNVPHRHTYFEVCQVGAYGSGTFFVEGTPFKLAPHDLFIARPGLTHQIVNTSSPTMELYWLSFVWLPGAAESGCEMSRWLDGFAAAHHPVVPDEKGQLTALWPALKAVAQADPHPGRDRQLVGLITTLLLTIIQIGTLTPARPPFTRIPDRATKVRLAVRYIYDNLNRRLPVSEIAAYLNVSPRHLARLFDRHLGVSPAAYIEKTRLERAQQLLQTEMPIKKIAATTGYGSVHHFSRAFSRRVGLSPGVYRDVYREKAAGRVPS